MSHKNPPIYQGHKFRKLSLRDIQAKAGLLTEIAQKARQLTQLKIDAWRRAHQAAINPDNPRRRALYAIYDDILLDGHLSGAIEHNRKNATLQKDFKVVDKNGKKNNDLTNFLEASWFKKFIKPCS